MRFVFCFSVSFLSLLCLAPLSLLSLLVQQLKFTAEITAVILVVNSIVLDSRRFAVLCCAVLCCAVLCCVVRCCALLCCSVLCWAGLCCAVLCSAVLWRAVFCCAVLCCVVLCCAVLCYAVLFCSFLCLALLSLLNLPVHQLKFTAKITAVFFAVTSSFLSLFCFFPSPRVGSFLFSSLAKRIWESVAELSGPLLVQVFSGFS